MTPSNIIILLVFIIIILTTIIILYFDNSNQNNKHQLASNGDFSIYINKLNKYINVKNNTIITITETITETKTPNQTPPSSKIPDDYELISNSIIIDNNNTNDDIFSIWRPVFKHKDDSHIEYSVLVKNIHKPSKIPYPIIANDTANRNDTKKLITYFNIANDSDNVILFYLVDDKYPYFVKKNIGDDQKNNETVKTRDILHIKLF